MKTLDWDVEYELCIFCKRKFVDDYAGFMVFDRKKLNRLHSRKHYADQVCNGCAEKEALGKL